MRSISKQLLIIFALLLLSVSKGFTQADEQMVEIATEMYNFGDVRDALEVFKKAIEINPTNAYANYMAGVCYLETIHKERSLPYFLKAYELRPDINPKILYMIGRAYHLGYQFDEAIEYYQKFSDQLRNDKVQGLSARQKKDEQEAVARRIYECSVAKELVASPDENISLINLGDVVNGEYPDYGPVISADGNTLYFTSKRQGSTGGKKDRDNQYFEDIYVSYKENGEWQKPLNLGSMVNTDLHESVIGLSYDAKQLFLYIDNDKYKADIFISKIEGKNKLTKPQPLPTTINTEYIENSMTISPDGSTLYFSSNRPGGVGGMDIYVSKLGKNGKWGTAVNIGTVINTPYDEEAPYMAADGKTLYFSSKGHKNMGGFDVFKTVYDSATSKWSEPVNLGYPINSTDNDINFVLSGDSKTGYYASVKNDGIGDLDIYMIKMEKEKTEEVVAKVEKREAPKKTLKDVVLKLEVYSKSSKSPLNANIEVYYKKDQKQIDTRTASDGKYSYSFKESSVTDVVVSIEMAGYVFKNITLAIPPAKEETQEVKQVVYLDDIQQGVTTILRNIYFDFDKTTLTRESDKELQKLLKLMKEKPFLRIRINGHTDSFGSRAYNNWLSEERAKAVASWLIKNGVDPSRIEVKGFGEDMPLASNDDEEEGRELNRRTEFTILSNVPVYSNK
ncbi:MAG TPA: OmpA family protein [Cytophagaceae bacterium]